MIAVNRETALLPSMAGLLMALCLAAGCASNEDFTVDDSEVSSAEELYYAIDGQLARRNFADAIANLELLEANFPFGAYAEQAQLELIYAYYQNYQYDAAIAAADRFIRLHPIHPSVDYAFYLRGLSSYAWQRSLLARVFPTDPSKRDRAKPQTAFSYFAELIRRFPDSEHAEDAARRMVYLRNLLARNEIHIGNYYLRRRAYLAAANRGRYVVENFQGSPAVSDGLALMVQSYLLLDLDDLARKSYQVLVANYPQHQSLDEQGRFVQYEPDQGGGRNWLNAISMGLIRAPRPPEYDSRKPSSG